MRWISLPLLAVLVVALATGPARADPYRTAIERQADTLVAAFDAHDGAALASVAAEKDSDLWRLADELAARGRADAARALALAAPQSEFAPLVVYLDAWDARSADPARRASLRAAAQAREAKDFDAVIAAVRAAPAGPDDVVSLSLASLEATALQALGRTDESAHAWEALAPRVERLGWRRLLVACVAGVAEHHSVAGRTEAAAEHYERCIRVADATVRRDLQRDLRVMLALMWWTAGAPERALRRAEEGLLLADAPGDALYAASLNTALGGAAEALGEIEEALARYRQAAQLMEAYAAEPTRPVVEAAAIRGAAIGVEGERLRVLLTQARYAESLPELERFVAMAERLGHKPYAGLLRVVLTAMRSMLEGDDAAAARLPLLTLMLPAGADSDALHARAALIGATVQLARGHTPQALAALARVRRGLQKHGLRAEDGYAALQLGAAALEQGRISEARALLTEARGLLADGTSIGLGLSIAELELAAADVRSGDSGGRARMLAQLDSLRPSGGWLLASGLLPAAQTLAHIGDHAGALALARECALLALTLTQGHGQDAAFVFAPRLVDSFEVGIRSARATGDVASLAWFIEGARARALRDALGVREALWDAALPDELRTELRESHRVEAAAARSLRRAQAVRDTALTATQRVALGRARERVAAVVRRVQREAQRAAGVAYPTIPTLAEIRASLQPGEVLVSYVLGAEAAEALALVVEPTAARIVALGPREPLEAAVTAFAPWDRSRDPAADLAVLRAALVTPLSLAPTTRRVLLSPDGLLHALPFQMLFEPRETASVGSGAVLRLLAAERGLRGEGVLALGDPQFDAERMAPAGATRGRRLVPLPGTREEALAVGDVVLLGAEASEGRLRAALATRPRWHAVHLATHGIIDMEHPLESALAMAEEEGEDGRLSVADVFGLRMPTDLAVLSACETARGRTVQGEGVHGLTRSFLLAGATRVLVSSWKVDDEATRVLMQRFYEAWKGGRGPAASLLDAQAFVRAEERWKHPYYWAAWTLWGLAD